MPRDVASALVLVNRFEKRCRADSAENAPGEVLAGMSFGAPLLSVEGTLAKTL
ncbi:hypothetical protein [uncultured Thermosynechococcus sp.]|uniref:hypothetical protein n=1 Tax=uncultured Thermosynechococcus sp. TaxID=436945 RepID=UPI00262B3E64|nr:hypothetical protein [uncultured Thermosynechococcus sp.]